MTAAPATTLRSPVVDALLDFAAYRGDDAARFDNWVEQLFPGWVDELQAIAGLMVAVDDLRTDEPGAALRRHVSSTAQWHPRLLDETAEGHADSFAAEATELAGTLAALITAERA